MDKPGLVTVSTPSAPNLKDNAVENWKTWKLMWENYSIISQIAKQTPDYQVAVFLHSLGVDGMRIHSTMNFVEGEDKNDLKVIIKKFDAYFIGETNEIYERCLLNSRLQAEGESVEQYVTALWSLASNCGFCDCIKNSLIRDRIVTGIRDNGTHKLLLQQRDFTAGNSSVIRHSYTAMAKRLDGYLFPGG